MSTTSRPKSPRRPAKPKAAPSNDNALGAALSWLRDRLQHMARPDPTAEPGDAPIPLEPVPALTDLQQRLGLSDFERNVLLLCTAAALDTRISLLCAAALDDPARPWPSFALALAVFDNPSWDALSPHRPLRHMRLIDVHGHDATPLTMSALRADDRIVDYVKGLNELDERIARTLSPWRAETDEPLPPSQQAAADTMLAFVQRGEPPREATLQLTGIDSAGKRLVARHVAQRLGLVLRHVDLTALPTSTADLDDWCRLWQRECRLLPMALCIDANERPAGDSAEAANAALNRALDRLPELVFVDTRDAAPLGAGTRDRLFVCAIDKPTAAEQTSAWTTALGRKQGALAARLAAQFNLNLPQIRAMAKDAASTEEGPADSTLWSACRRAALPKMEQLAQPIESRVGWDDIVLPDDAMALLHQIVAQVRWRRRVYGDWGFEQKMSRGLGLSALFHGESGTGKTLAAEVIAHELQLSLYRIDLSAIVSKYIGETEKNLQRVFDAAEDGGSILFFDEADALFGKRSEVRDSHDRYANIETNYLLQRIESFRGLAILATNLKGAMDSAFMRRLRFVVPFTVPGLRERTLMWQRVFPAQAPVDDLDPARLARFDCTGASIHSIALNAAFLAAHHGTNVTMPLLLEAARSELLKLGRPVDEAQLRPMPLRGARA